MTACRLLIRSTPRCSRTANRVGDGVWDHRLTGNSGDEVPCAVLTGRQTPVRLRTRRDGLQPTTACSIVLPRLEAVDPHSRAGASRDGDELVPSVRAGVFTMPADGRSAPVQAVRSHSRACFIGCR
jgi:hypothetical protein